MNKFEKRKINNKDRWLYKSNNKLYIKYKNEFVLYSEFKKIMKGGLIYDVDSVKINFKQQKIKFIEKTNKEVESIIIQELNKCKYMVSKPDEIIIDEEDYKTRGGKLLNEAKKAYNMYLHKIYSVCNVYGNNEKFYNIIKEMGIILLLRIKLIEHFKDKFYSYDIYSNYVANYNDKILVDLEYNYDLEIKKLEKKHRLEKLSKGSQLLDSLIKKRKLNSNSNKSTKL
jgi:hypothetical protein